VVARTGRKKNRKHIPHLLYTLENTVLPYTNS